MGQANSNGSLVWIMNYRHSRADRHETVINFSSNASIEHVATTTVSFTVNSKRHSITTKLTTFTLSPCDTLPVIYVFVTYGHKLVVNVDIKACNSAISFHFMCVDYVVHIAFLCTELLLCFILVVFYIVFYIAYHCN